jgi:hypothetical protein
MTVIVKGQKGVYGEDVQILACCKTSGTMALR